MPTHPTIRRALISVYDKTGVVDFARALHEEFNVELISTGGTAKVLRDAGLPVTLIEDLTGYPEMLDGRVKTLHPAIHAAILADRDNPEHMRQLAAHGIQPIDLVVVNLYPFEKTVADPNCTFEQAIEMIDIGGVTLLRAAAKNHKHVVVECRPLHASGLLAWLRDPENARYDAEHQGRALAAFWATTDYDSKIASWLSRDETGRPYVRFIELHDSAEIGLRYAENPHQRGEVRIVPGIAGGPKVVDAGVGGRPETTPMSFNNYLDADAALGLCAELARAGAAGAWRELWHRLPTGATGETRANSHWLEPGATIPTGAGLPAAAAATPVEAVARASTAPPAVCVFIKHTNACGASVVAPEDDTQEAHRAARVEAYRRAYLGDPNAAMGGILAVDFDVDAGFAALVMETYARFGKPLKEAGAAYAPGGFFVEVWIAPRFTDDAVAVIRGTYDPATAKPEPGEPRFAPAAAAPTELRPAVAPEPPGGAAGAPAAPRDVAAPSGAPAPKKDWGQRVRLLAVGDMTVPPDPNALVYRSIAGGMLVQTPDLAGLDEEAWKVVTQRAPTPTEMDDLRLAWLVCKHTKSNAITLCKDGMLLGSGAGQMSRVMSCRLATWLARENGHLGSGARSAGRGKDERVGGSAGVVAASDAFFPFPDGPQILIDVGVTALIQPGGGKRDQETIDLCNARGVAMIFTGTRHFRH